MPFKNNSKLYENNFSSEIAFMFTSVVGCDNKICTSTYIRDKIALHRGVI